MRHQVKGRKLNRSTPHRKATMQALCVALINEQRIQTTLAKAKELRRYIEPLITKAKNDTSHNRRQVFSFLQDKHAVTELFEEVGPAAADRPGGYTRVLKLGHRYGDAAEMAVIELVDYNDVQPETKDSKKKRTRRAGKSKKTTPAEPASKEEKSASTDSSTEATDTKKSDKAKASVKKDEATDDSEKKEKTPAKSEAEKEKKAEKKSADDDKK